MEDREGSRWAQFIEPSSDVSHVTEQRHARMLAATCLTLIGLGTVYVAVQAVAWQAAGGLQAGITTALGIVALGTLLLTYALVRTGHHNTGALLLAGTVYAAAWMVVITDTILVRNFSASPLIIATVLASVVVRARDLIGFHIVNLGAAVLALLFLDPMGTSWLLAAGQYSIVAALLSKQASIMDEDLLRLDRETSEMQSILENTDCMILNIDREYRVRLFNSAARESASREASAPLRHGMSLMSLLPEERHAEAVELVAQALGGRRVNQTIAWTAGDRQCHLDISINPIIDRSGRVAGASIFARDIHERIEAEYESQRRLEKVRTAVVNAASHELNTPLTPIIMQMSLLRSGQLGALSQKQERALDTVQRNLDHLRALTQQFLEVTRLEQDLAQMHRTVVDVGPVLHRNVPSGTKIPIQLDIQDDDLFVSGDEQALGVLVRQLVAAVGSRQGDGIIHVVGRHKADQVQIEAFDASTQMSEEETAALHEAMQEDSLAFARGGPALAFYIVHRIVEQHGGEMDIEWIAGQGLRVRIRIPAADPTTHRNHRGNRRAASLRPAWRSMRPRWGENASHAEPN